MFYFSGNDQKIIVESRQSSRYPGRILIVRHHGKFALAPKLQFIEVLEDGGFSAVSRGTMLPFRVSRVTGAAKSLPGTKRHHKFSPVCFFHPVFVLSLALRHTFCRNSTTPPIRTRRRMPTVTTILARL